MRVSKTQIRIVMIVVWFALFALLLKWAFDSASV